MTEKVAYTTTRYKESRRPSDDAASVGRWVIGTAIIFSAFGFAMGAGISWAAGFSFLGGVSFGFALAGLIGFLIGILRIITYDKKPFVDITEHTTEPVIYDSEEPKPQPPMGGNLPINTAKKDGHIVNYGGEEYEFTDNQINGMYSRVENEIYGVGRDAFGFGSDYDMLMRIMGGLGYWLITQKVQKNGVKRSAEWKEDGRAWLTSRMRG